MVPPITRFAWLILPVGACFGRDLYPKALCARLASDELSTRTFTCVARGGKFQSSERILQYFESVRL